MSLFVGTLSYVYPLFTFRPKITVPYLRLPNSAHLYFCSAIDIFKVFVRAREALGQLSTKFTRIVVL